MKTKFESELRAYLTKKRVRPSHLARAAGISPASISLFLSGKRGLNLETYEKLKAVMK